MPRPPRLHVPGAIYHVTLRGNHRRRIFLKESDYRFLETLLAEVTTDHDLLVHAYCWMPNHIHLALQVSQQPLARPMQRLASRYARRFQSNLETTGHLFERRYHATVVDSDRYLMALVRYIHLNPVRAALVAAPEHYRWSSHPAYLAGAGPDWLTTSAVLGRLAADLAEARRVFADFVREVPSEVELDYLRGKAARFDERNREIPVTSQPWPNAEPLEEIIHDECGSLGVRPEDLILGIQGRQHSLARARIAWRALRSGAVGSLTELAPRLGRSASALSENLRASRARRPELFRILEFRNSGTKPGNP